ncbi:MAG: sulfurtransferase, partial [Burkholderiaceae bacterium]
MFRKMLWVLAAVAASVFAVSPAMATAGDRGHLVSAAWLAQNLKSEDLLVLDASPPPMYAAKHIPGAINVDVFTYGAQEIPAAEMERRFQSWGISAGKKIVIYDQGGSYMATRLFFDLYYQGFPATDLLVLDGGLAKWQEVGGQVTKEPTPTPTPGSFRITRTNDSARVRLPEFLAASGDPTNQVLVEALEPTYHFGENKFFDRSGHIPNGIMLPTADFFNADKTFKSDEELRRMLAYLGVKPEQKIHAYCGGGIAASVPFFALKFVLNYPNVTLYK